MALPKYQVFISSTFRNMEHARKAAIAGVSDARHIHIALETFAPESAGDLEVIKREVAGCQVYILILGPTYGRKPKGKAKSYTETEFRHAEQSGKHILVFSLNWDDVMAQRRKLRPSRDAEEIATTRKLEAFFKYATRGTHFVREWRWNQEHELRRYVSNALTELPYRKDAPKGLLPELDTEGGGLYASLLQNEFLRDTVNAILQYSVLSMRMSSNVEAKVRAAEFLAHRYHRRMESEQTRGIFFESGSTVVYVANALSATNLWQRVVWKEGEPSKRISTNNVLVYLLLWLGRRVPCAHFPWGSPEATYGASYGPVAELEPLEPLFMEPLDQDARDAIANLGSSQLALRPENTSLIITAASGLQLSRKHILAGEEGYIAPKSLEKQIGRCFGPHVGSYRNKVLKRYLYDTGIPAMLVIDSSKINCPIDVRKCHFLFDEELTWQEVLEQRPLAVCIGCPTGRLKEYKQLVKDEMPNCELVESPPIKSYSAFILRNQAFTRLFSE